MHGAIIVLFSHTYISTLQVSLCYQNHIRMQAETENWIFRMYEHDGVGPVPSLYIGTTVPMIYTSAKSYFSKNEEGGRDGRSHETKLWNPRCSMHVKS